MGDVFGDVVEHSDSGFAFVAGLEHIHFHLPNEVGFGFGEKFFVGWGELVLFHADPF